MNLKTLMKNLMKNSSSSRMNNMENDTICKKCCSSSTVLLVLYFTINFVIVIGSVCVICVSFVVSSAFL
jgi:hypothetical protein